MTIQEYQFANLPIDKKHELRALSFRSIIGLMTEDEASAVLLVEPSTLATWRSQGKGPDYVKLGKAVFYTVNALGAWVNTELARQRESRQA